MIGSAMLRVLSKNDAWHVVGAVRRPSVKEGPRDRLVHGLDLANSDHLMKMIHMVLPDVVVNCAGLTKHIPEGNDPISAITINALLPHRLSEYCSLIGARLIHVSTDCVFSGAKGNYLEDDVPDATDTYGRTKVLGEVMGLNVLTLRTSTIGHEAGTKRGLLEWFLMQEACRGYRSFRFSGLPTVEFAKIVRDIVIPNQALTGLYHVGASPIDKFSLLQMVANEYGKDIQIEPNDEVCIDRSLNSAKFADATGYMAPTWQELIRVMHQDHIYRS